MSIQIPLIERESYQDNDYYRAIKPSKNLGHKVDHLFALITQRLPLLFRECFVLGRLVVWYAPNYDAATK